MNIERRRQRFMFMFQNWLHITHNIWKCLHTWNNDIFKIAHFYRCTLLNMYILLFGVKIFEKQCHEHTRLVISYLSSVHSCFLSHKSSLMKKKKKKRKQRKTHKSWREKRKNISTKKKKEKEKANARRSIYLAFRNLQYCHTNAHDQG